MTDLNIYAHGKLLISSEYFVLDGAKALAIPTHFGQHLKVSYLNLSANQIHWKAFRSNGEEWLNLNFDKQTLQSNSDSKEAKTLTKILLAAKELNPKFLSGKENIEIETRLEFQNEWGLGSSSTLIYAIAKWANIDAYTLLQKTMGGSGYDVACAAIDTPILYQLKQGKPEVQSIHFLPAFSDQIYFAFLGQKQLSTQGINIYKESTADKKSCIKWLDVITDAMVNCTSIGKFEQLIHEHEQIISETLHLERVQSKLFPDYWGKVKSLGAWGGDFVMLTNTRSRRELTDYLNTKNINVIFSFDEMIYRTV